MDLDAEKMFYLYILVNENKNRTYAGSTANLNKRLEEHNNGKVKSSRPYRPYKILYWEGFNTLSEARKHESYYKSTSGRREISEILKKDHL